jgi:hypothetical protein
MDMKKVMIIRAYGLNWDYDLYMVPDDVVLEAEKLMANGEWANAYKLIIKNDKTSNTHLRRKNWHDLNTVDFLLEYIEGVTV